MATKTKSMPKGLAVTSKDGNIVYTLYDTDIAVINPGLNSITLNTGGFYTNHTKKCMNLALQDKGFTVYQRDSHWYVDCNDSANTINFFDGITIL